MRDTAAECVIDLESVVGGKATIAGPRFGRPIEGAKFVAEADGNLPDDTALLPNYPNPFN